jgi:hypothetical protein
MPLACKNTFYSAPRRCCWLLAERVTYAHVLPSLLGGAAEGMDEVLR